MIRLKLSLTLFQFFVFVNLNTCTGHWPNIRMSFRGSFVTSSFGNKCGGGDDAREDDGVMSPDARSLCEGLEAKLTSSVSPTVGQSCQPLPTNSRNCDITVQAPPG